jgi:SAM-dependent methyltransferase
LASDFDALITDAEREPFSGWDFSYITATNRYRLEPVSWDYRAIVLERMKKAESMLDMGTGGGERLASLQTFPKVTYATEAYAPNVPIARKRLEPLGVKVVQIMSDDNLPFANETFDLIINHHEAYSVKEVYRILKHSGVFLTQQVGDRDNLELNELLEGKLHGTTKEEHWNLEIATQELQSAGFEILDKKEEFPKTVFLDVGAVVFYLKAIPWKIQDFNVERYRKQLAELHQQVLAEGKLEVTSHRFYVEASKRA